MLCKYCGWGDQIKTSCETSAQAGLCELNKDNVRRFMLRFKNAPVPDLVKSLRYQDPQKSKWGSYFEFLERVE